MVAYPAAENSSAPRQASRAASAIGAAPARRVCARASRSDDANRRRSGGTIRSRWRPRRHTSGPIVLRRGPVVRSTHEAQPFRTRLRGGSAEVGQFDPGGGQVGFCLVDVPCCGGGVVDRPLELLRGCAFVAPSHGGEVAAMSTAGMNRAVAGIMVRSWWISSLQTWGLVSPSGGVAASPPQRGHADCRAGAA